MPHATPRLKTKKKRSNADTPHIPTTCHMLLLVLRPRRREAMQILLISLRQDGEGDICDRTRLSDICLADDSLLSGTCSMTHSSPQVHSSGVRLYRIGNKARARRQRTPDVDHAAAAGTTNRGDLSS
jgi:hypothetical protein